MFYPVAFEMDYAERRSRVTTLVRWLLAIPHFVFVYFYSLAFVVVLLIAWFALVFTARWPPSLYVFAGNYLRYLARLSAYAYLGVDQYPPFTGAEDDRYPARLRIAPPLAHYSRVKVLFRPIYAIGALVIRYALGIVLMFVSLASWVVIVITGRQPAGLQDALRFSLSYTLRSDALIYLITETYPTLSDESGRSSTPTG